MRARHPRPDDASVATWVVHAPWAHPLWHSYAIMLIHLRPIPATPPPVINLAGATHELFVFALDPDYRPSPDEHFKLLTPGNFAAQFVAGSDEGATTRVRADIEAITRGELNPDTDALSQWVARYGDNGLRIEYRRPQGSA